jgi:hypothetical protein
MTDPLDDVLRSAHEHGEVVLYYPPRSPASRDYAIEVVDAAAFEAAQTEGGEMAS